jgi:hypothetical protein
MDISIPEFPNSDYDKFNITSNKDRKYNCVAWAAGSSDKWWWPVEGAYWPLNARREISINAFVEMFEMLGYELCKNENFEIGFEKIIIYASNDKPTHVSRQISEEKWTSKLGESFDIQHTINSMANGLYGNIVRFMKKQI